MTFVKICGITNVEDARLALEAGADALGLNFVRTSKRVIDLATAAHISDAVAGRVELVAVVANRTARELEELRAASGIRWLQLHGAESSEELELLLPNAYKAVAIAGPEDVARASEYGGERLLVDAKVPGELGGTGARFDWSLAVPLTKRRDLIVAGGLTPENVAEAMRALSPFGVDVASGVEMRQNPRAKDPAKLSAFVAAVRAADLAR
ncbi:MAG TPA: phosphoribosylanthranilate isomerase [Polyangiaceae bacterium]|jgi:phosphoribosylanthranilate isomerase|nr:phosphoribosylanthranilate isomerase [Polyangiaceae bacterium]